MGFNIACDSGWHQCRPVPPGTDALSNIRGTLIHRRHRERDTTAKADAAACIPTVDRLNDCVLRLLACLSITGTLDHTESGQAQNLLPTVPMFELLGLVTANDKKQPGPGIASLQLQERVHRKAGTWATDLRVINLHPINFSKGKLSHLQSMVRHGRRRGAMSRPARGKDVHSVQLKMAQGRLDKSNVGEMRRVEGPAKDAEAPHRGPSGRACRQTQSRFGKKRE